MESPLKTNQASNLPNIIPEGITQKVFTPVYNFFTSELIGGFVVGFLVTVLLGYLLFYYKPSHKMLRNLKSSNKLFVKGSYYSLGALVICVFNCGLYSMTRENSHVYFAKIFSTSSFLYFGKSVMGTLFVLTMLLNFIEEFVKVVVFLIKILLIPAALCILVVDFSFFSFFLLVSAVLTTMFLCSPTAKLYYENMQKSLSNVGVFIFSKYQVFLPFYFLTSAIQGAFIIFAITFIQRSDNVAQMSLALPVVFAIMWFVGFIDLVNKHFAASFYHNTSKNSNNTLIKTLEAVKNSLDIFAAVSLLISGLHVLIWKLEEIQKHYENKQIVEKKSYWLIIFLLSWTVRVLKGIAETKTFLNDVDIVLSIDEEDSKTQDGVDNNIKQKVYTKQNPVTFFLRLFLLLFVAIYLIMNGKGVSAWSFNNNYTNIIYGLLQLIQRNASLLSFSFVFCCLFANAFISSIEIIYLYGQFNDAKNIKGQKNTTDNDIPVNEIYNEKEN